MQVEGRVGRQPLAKIRWEAGGRQARESPGHDPRELRCLAHEGISVDRRQNLTPVGKKSRRGDTKYLMTILVRNARLESERVESERVVAKRARWLLSVACAISAGVHLALVPEHLHESLILAAGFAVTAVALFATAVWNARGPASAESAALTSGLLVVLIALFAASRSIGLPGVAEAEPLDVVGGLTQVVQVIGLAAALTLMRRSTR